MSDNQILLCAVIFYAISVIVALFLEAEYCEEIVIKDIVVCLFLGWAILITYPFTLINWNYTLWKKK